MSLSFLVVLWLYATVLGISVGAGLYESRIVVPLWRVTPPAQWQNTGTAFWAYVTTGPLTLLVIAGLVLTLPAASSAQTWLLSSLLVAVLERATTFGYFIPTMIRLQRQTETTARVAARLQQWSNLNYARHGLSIVSWLLAMKAMTLTGSG